MLATVVQGAVRVVAEKSDNPLVPATPELILGVVAFALLFFLLSKTVFPMFEKAYQARTDAIEGGLKQAEEAQAEATRALASYQSQLAEARSEASRIRDEARAEAQAIGEELRAQARAEAQDIVTRAQAQMDAERAATIAELRREVGSLAVDLAGRIVGQALESDARQAALVDGFIADLERQGA